MTLGDSIRDGVNWTVVGKFGQHLLHFAFSVVLARLLVPADFGLVVTVQVFTGVAGVIAGGGMGQALIQAKTLGPRDTQAVFTAQLAIGIGLYLLFFTLAPWFARWFDQPLYNTLMRVSALSFILRPFANIPNSLLQREMRFRAKAAINMAILAVTGASSITMALAHMGVWSLVLGGLLGALTNVVLSSAISGWRPRFAIDRAVLRRLGGYGLKVSANDMVVYLRRQTGNFIISRFMGPAAVGLYNKAASLNELPTQTLSGSAYGVVFRALARIQDNLDQSKYVYLRTITLDTVYTYPFYVLMWWIAEPFIVTVYGKNWAGAAPALEILVLAGLCMSINTQSGAVAAARKLLGRELVIQLAGWALIITATLIGYHWGVIGVACAVVFVSATMAAAMAGLAMRELRVRVRDMARALRPSLLLNAILFVALAGVDATVGAAARHAGAAIYVLVMAAAGGLVYGGCFLFLPVPQLATEAARWKARLRLTPRPAGSVVGGGGQ